MAMLRISALALWALFWVYWLESARREGGDPRPVGLAVPAHRAGHSRGLCPAGPNPQPVRTCSERYWASEVTIVKSAHRLRRLGPGCCRSRAPRPRFRRALGRFPPHPPRWPSGAPGPAVRRRRMRSRRSPRTGKAGGAAENRLWRRFGEVDTTGTYCASGWAVMGATWSRGSPRRWSAWRPRTRRSRRQRSSAGL